MKTGDVQLPSQSLEIVMEQSEVYTVWLQRPLLAIRLCSQSPRGISHMIPLEMFRLPSFFSAKLTGRILERGGVGQSPQPASQPAHNALRVKARNKPQLLKVVYYYHYFQANVLVHCWGSTNSGEGWTEIVEIPQCENQQWASIPSMKVIYGPGEKSLRIIRD